MNKNILVEIDDRKAVVTLNNPEKLNALSEDLLTELKEVFVSLNQNPSIRVVLLQGMGKAFVAGADIKTMSVFSEEQAREWACFGSDVFRLIETSPKVTIAMINGYALGGGLELAMACDIRIACRGAILGQPEVSLGIIPGFSGTQRLPMLIGMAKAKELIYTGEAIKADEAFRLGLVNAVVELEELTSYAQGLANKILKHSFSAQQKAKEAIHAAAIPNIMQGIETEEKLFSECFRHPDAKCGMEAFLKKEPPKFQS